MVRAFRLVLSPIAAIVYLSSASWTPLAIGQPSPPQIADWTIMVCLNGDNNLKPFAMMNFKQMAKAGSTDRVHIVVQFDSIAKYDFTPPVWAQTLRFHMSVVGPNNPPTRPVPDDALKAADGGINQELDMGSGQTLSNFVEWAAVKYPARQYALIIWDHGQGYRGDPDGNQVKVFRSATSSPFKTVSNDETNRSQLYVRDIQNSLGASVSKLVNSNVLSRPKLDLVGFDACLMAMVETAYAMRQSADVMVGSQDLEPGEGWRYDDWLAKLVADPGMNASNLGKLIVPSYKQAYGNTAAPSSDPKTTLSAIDLTRIDSLASAISGLAKSMSDKLAAIYPQIKAARQSTPVYAPNAFNDGKEYFFHVDVGKFVDELASRVNDSTVLQNAQVVRASLRAAVLETYAGAERKPYGSNGLCIYFPASLLAYRRDQYAERGYEKHNPPTQWPVQFVDDQLWSDFLHVYYTKVQQ